MLKDIPGFEGKYAITENGEIFSYPKKVCKKGKWLSIQKMWNGYWRVVLYRKEAPRRYYLVHRLVAMAHLPLIEGKNVINHKDGNKSNNHVSNLEWCTQSENAKHAFRTGLAILSPQTLKILKYGPRNRSVSDEMIFAMREDYRNGMIKNKIAIKYGIHRAIVGDILNGKTYKYTREQLLAKLNA